jgi:small subunit ribosomal protein S2
LTTSETNNAAHPEAQGPADLRTLFNAGVHFGHPTKRWNPKMRQYIFTKRRGAHIIDLAKTASALEDAKKYITKVVGSGGQCLMVGTKKQAQTAIETEARRAGAFYINQRWLGGLLTNFQTIQGRVEKLIKLEDQIAKGELQVQTKREEQSVQTEVARLNKYLGGIKEMTRLPAVIFMVDIGKEDIAVHEATRLGIPVVAIVDTNCDPERVQFPIPANDDAVRSIGLIAAHIADAILEGRAMSQKVREDKMAAEAELEAMESSARSEAQAAAAARMEAPVATAEALREAEEEEANQPRPSV